MASVNSSDWRAICEQFTTALNLTEVESRKDPENDPFRSKYKAREILREIYSALKNFEATEADSETSGERGEEQVVDGEKDGQCFYGDSPAGWRAAKLAAVEYFLGVNHIETEELSAGQEHLMNCMKLIDKWSTSSMNVSLVIHVKNQLGILWSGRGETETAKAFLETAEGTYLRYMKKEGSPPTDMTEYFSTEENQLTHQERTKRYWKRNDILYTHYNLFSVKVNSETELSATYCHSTLQRQLQLNQFNPMEWALNAATLSQYYINKVSCHYARRVVRPGHSRDQLRQKRADIARCWIKYCLNLLLDAKKALEDNIGELDGDRQEELKAARRAEVEEEEKSRKSALLFGSEDTFDSIASLEEKVQSLTPLDFTDARALFLVGQTYVTQAKEYFEMDGFVTDHIEILQDHSALFRALAFFEDDLERRCKMHKRRVDMLEPICNDLNGHYYLVIRRQLMFELAEIYNEMMDLKLTVANCQSDSETLDSHTIKKLNHLCGASAKFFEMFLESLRSPEGKLPEVLEEEVLRPALVARFRVARLYSRVICPVISDKLENLNKSLDHYKYVAQYGDAHPEASAAVETELELSREMVSLLPIKINRLKAQMISNN
uniref:KIF-binding protein n=1 Tax=Gadus morhua TaxID=8049 RepID=A0A8C5AFE9_GADMO